MKTHEIEMLESRVRQLERMNLQTEELATVLQLKIIMLNKQITGLKMMLRTADKLLGKAQSEINEYQLLCSGGKTYART